jgi:hypothetical protein
MATSSGADVPSREEGMNPDEISQAEKRRILAEDRRSRTYHAAAQSFIDEDRGGRFSVLEKPVVSGLVRYPKLPGSILERRQQ